MRSEKGPVAVMITTDGGKSWETYRIYGVLMSVRYRLRGFTGELYMPHGRCRAERSDGTPCEIPYIPVGSALLVGSAARSEKDSPPTDALRVTEIQTRNGETVGYTRLRLA